MRKIFFIASVMFLCGFSCAAQTINQNEFDKIVDYVNCKYAKAYIEKYASRPQETPNAAKKVIEPTPSQATPVSKESENKSECHWVMWLVIILEGILLCVFSYFLYRLWKRCDRKSLESKKFDKSSNVEIFEAKLQQLERKFGELQEKVRNIKVESNDQNTTKVEEKVKETPGSVLETQNSNVKYFRTKQGKILQDELPNESDASFKIFSINNDEAKFEYCGGVVNSDFFTEICTFENNPANIPYKKEIRTITPGTAKRDNNNWVISKPAKIKFI